MRIAVLNYSGNVGKTTISQHMLLPRLNYEILRVETLNSDGEGNGQKMAAEDFDKIFNTILNLDDVIIDVGSSNIETFKSKLTFDFAGSHSFIDYFIIPVTPDAKQQIDTIKTIIEFIELGVACEKIKVIFNRVNIKKDIKEQFSTILKSEELKAVCFEITEDTPCISDSTLFKTLERANLTYNNVKDYPTISELDEQLAGKSGKEKVLLELQKFYKLGFDSYQKQMQHAFDSLNII
ncbi:TPA: transcriptional regulator [Escherichia coli]